VETGNLPASFAILTKTPSQAVDYEARMIDMLPEPDEVDVRVNLLQVPRQGEDGSHFGVGQNRPRRQAIDEELKGGALECFPHA
jgi:hypothetical protein